MPHICSSCDPIPWIRNPISDSDTVLHSWQEVAKWPENKSDTLSTATTGTTIDMFASSKLTFKSEHNLHLLRLIHLSHQILSLIQSDHLLHKTEQNTQECRRLLTAECMFACFDGWLWTATEVCHEDVYDLQLLPCHVLRLIFKWNSILVIVLVYTDMHEVKLSSLIQEQRMQISNIISFVLSISTFLTLLISWNRNIPYSKEKAHQTSR